MKSLGNLGGFLKWSKVEFSLAGPLSAGMSAAANPFKIPVDVHFNAPSGKAFMVPAFYEGDGQGGLDGNLWRVRFAPEETGSWTFQSSSTHPDLDGYTGSFDVTPVANCAGYNPGTLPDFYCQGRLAYVGAHYLRFAEGIYWLKGGIDDPEDFLAEGVNAGFPTKEDAVDFLASRSVNSIYLLLHNIGGDSQNVWPWVGSTPGEARMNHEHFDPAKLARWEALFTYIQAKGLVLHLVFEDDSGWTGFNRDLYYREMIGRFGHHNGLYWNIAEEYNETYTVAQVQSFADQIRALDPYDHPLTVHHQGVLENWNPFLGDSRFDLTSFQTLLKPVNAEAATWFQKVESPGRVIPISFDETGKTTQNDRALARHIVWSAYLGGANFELHVQPLTSYTAFAAHFEDMQRARQVMEQLPFWQMRPANALASRGYVFAQPGETYLVYQPQGGSFTLDLTSNTNSYAAEWFNPRDGTVQASGDIAGGSVLALNTPDGNDWAFLLKRKGGGANVAPLASDAAFTTTAGAAVAVQLPYTDPDGPGPYTITIVMPPANGVLAGSGQAYIYTPNAGFVGQDTFTWKVNDGLADSNTATVTVQVNLAGNQAPVAEDQSITLAQDTSADIQLVYIDPDGPGPYTVTLLTQPAHGTLAGANNDYTYTPDPGYTGADSFRWKVNDGLSDSNIASVSITVTGSYLVTILPAADAYVDSARPRNNFGREPALRVKSNASGVQITYLKFTLSDPGVVERAILKLFVLNTGGGGEIRTASNTSWGETTVNYRNQLTVDGAVVATFERVNQNTTVSIDVTGAFTAQGTVTLVIQTSQSDDVVFSSREAPSRRRPVLEVTLHP
jgi:hypothetical protein